MPKTKQPPKKKTFDNKPFAGLAKKKPKRGPQNKSTSRPKNDKNEHQEPSSKNEEELFLRAMSDVSPLSKRTTALPPFPPVLVEKSTEEQEREEVVKELLDLVAGESPLAIHETDECIEGATEGLDPRILTQLRKGDFSIQAHLDLHGYHREEARQKVEAFIDNAILTGKRCVLIIHGRGHGSKDHVPILKNALCNWFTKRGLRKKILAFTTAKTYDGGAGAVYVLLRKRSSLR